MAKFWEISKRTVDAFRKTIDFYYWRGMPIARKWPQGPVSAPTTSQKRSQYAFKQTRKRLKEHFWYKKDLSRELYKGISQAWLDHYTGSFLQYYHFWKTIPPIITSITVLINADPVRLEIKGYNISNLWLKFYSGKPRNRIAWKYRAGVHDYCMKEGASGRYGSYPIDDLYTPLTVEHATTSLYERYYRKTYLDATRSMSKSELWANALNESAQTSTRTLTTQRYMRQEGHFQFPATGQYLGEIKTWELMRRASTLVIDPAWLLDSSISLACIFKVGPTTLGNDEFVCDIEGTPCSPTGKNFVAYFDIQKYISQGNVFFCKGAPAFPSYQKQKDADGNPDFNDSDIDYSLGPADKINLQVRRMLPGYYCDVPRKWFEGDGSFLAHDPFSGVMLGPWVKTSKFWSQLNP